MLLHNRVTLTGSSNLERIRAIKNFSGVDCGDKTWDFGEDYKPRKRWPRKQWVIPLLKVFLVMQWQMNGLVATPGLVSGTVANDPNIVRPPLYYYRYNKPEGKKSSKFYITCDWMRWNSNAKAPLIVWGPWDIDLILNKLFPSFHLPFDSPESAPPKWFNILRKN